MPQLWRKCLFAGLTLALALPALGAGYSISLDQVHLTVTPSWGYIGHEFDCNAWCDYTVTVPDGEEVEDEAGGQGTVYVARSYTWDFGANAHPEMVSGEGHYRVNYSADGSRTIRITMRVELRSADTGQLLASDGPMSASKVVGIYDPPVLIVSAPSRCSVYQTITISATIEDYQISGIPINFACGFLAFPNGSTATTDAGGVATVVATAGATPSPCLNGTIVSASTQDAAGQPLTGQDAFTIVRMNGASPANREIVVGHLPDNSLYTVVLTYSVSPPVAGVPVAFSFAPGEGRGVNYPASLEDAASATNANGHAAVRVRSSDLRETATVRCAYQVSSGTADVTFVGITGVSTYTE